VVLSQSVDRPAADVRFGLKTVLNRPKIRSMQSVTPIDRVLDRLAVDLEPFAMCKVARGWRLRMGGPKSTTFHFVLRGDGRLRAGADFWEPIGSCCLCVVPPGIAHSLESGDVVTREAAAENVLQRAGDALQFVAGGDGGLTVACGRADATYGGGLRLFDMLREPLVFDFSGSLQMQNIFERILEEERSKRVGSKAMTAALMRECLVLTLRRLHEDPNCPLPWLTSLRDRRMAELVEGILSQPAEPHSVASLAEKTFMSRSVFSQTFKAQFGLSPLAFVSEVRLRKSAELLQGTDLTVDAVARSVGYASRSHFSRAFRSRFGTPPTSFRATSNGVSDADRAAAP
jgi:AraC-like DNA-binding protein